MTSFFIPDSAPVFAYSSSWSAAYHSLPSGQDETFHQTETEGTISFNLTASSVHFSTPYSDSTPPKCDVQYRVNASVWMDGCGIPNLPDGTHMLELRPRGQGMQFLGVKGEMSLQRTKHQNVTIDDGAPQFAFSVSAWSHFPPSQSTSEGMPQEVTAAFGDLSAAFNRTMTVSSGAGSTAELRFQGAALYLYGVSGPEMGAGEIQLDGRSVASVNASLPWREYSTLLYTAGGLDPTAEHVLTISNMSPGKMLAIDYALITVPDISGPNTLVLIIGGAVGGGILLVLALLAVWFFVVRQRNLRRFQNLHSARSFGNGTSTSPQSDEKSSWRNMPGSGAASPISPVSITFSDDSRARQRSTTQLVYRSPAVAADRIDVESDYPDYIPYTGPVAPRPESEAESVVVPDIVGASASAANWLQGQSEGKSRTRPAGKHISVRSAYSTASENNGGTFPLHRAITGSPDSSCKVALSHASISGPSSESSATRGTALTPQLSSRSAASPFDVPLAAIDYFAVPINWRDQQRPLDMRMHPQPEPDASMSSSGMHTLGEVADVPLTAVEFTSPPSRTLLLRMESPMLPSPGGDSLRSADQATISQARRIDGDQIAARVWPGRSVVPSYYTASLVPLDSVQETLHAGHQVRAAPELYPSHGEKPCPTSSTRRPFYHRQLSAITSADGCSTGSVSSPGAGTSGTSRSHSRAPSAVPSSAALTAFFPSTPSTPSLRRGVSVRSAKTARSFFSTFMAGSRSPVWRGGELPALPQPGISARPDSDLFGESVSVYRRSSAASTPSLARVDETGASPDAFNCAGSGTPSSNLRSLRIAERDENQSSNFFIELDPGSPVTVASRPHSGQPSW